MTYQCTLQGRSMGAGASEITVQDLVSKIMQKVSGVFSSIPGIGSVVGKITSVAGTVVSGLLVNKITAQYKSSKLLPAQVGQLGTDELADFVLSEIAKASFGNVWTWNEDKTHIKLSFLDDYGVSWAYAFGTFTPNTIGSSTRGGQLFGTVLNKINEVVSDLSGVQAHDTTPPVSDNWNMTPPTTSTIAAAATVADLADILEKQAKALAAQYYNVALGKRDMTSAVVLQAVMQKANGFYAQMYYSKLNDLLNKAIASPNAAAGIAAGMAPVLAQMTIPPAGAGATANAARASLIPIFYAHTLAFAKSIIEKKGFTSGIAPSSAPASTGSSKTILIAAAAGVAALILLSK